MHMNANDSLHVGICLLGLKILEYAGDIPFDIKINCIWLTTESFKDESSTLIFIQKYSMFSLLCILVEMGCWRITKKCIQ